MKYSILALATLLLFIQLPAHAQEAEAPSEVVSPVADDPTYAERLELAEKMHELNPVRSQVYGAIDQFALRRPAEEREAFKSSMRNVFNIKALEKISVDAYAATFTVEELRAMVEYYSKPEAKSAGEKLANYNALVYPELMRMLDRAAMRIRTGK